MRGKREICMLRELFALVNDPLFSADKTRRSSLSNCKNWSVPRRSPSLLIGWISIFCYCAKKNLRLHAKQYRASDINLTWCSSSLDNLFESTMVISKKSSITASRGYDKKSLEKLEHSDPVHNKHMQNHFERRRFPDSQEVIGTISYTPLRGHIKSKALLSKGITSNTVSNLHLREDGVGTKQWVGRMLANDSQIFSKTTSCLPDINDRVMNCNLIKGKGRHEYIPRSFCSFCSCSSICMHFSQSLLPFCSFLLFLLASYLHYILRLLNA